MKRFEIKEQYDLEDYIALIHFLRGPEGCPWDRVQTHESIRRNVLEEAYETAHAIDSGDVDNLREELGDLLMQVLLHADMESDVGHFDINDVADGACKKLVFRHAHVFGTARADDPEAALVTWDAQKRQEKGQKSTAEAMASVPENFPALWRAEKMQKKAAAVGFDWPDTAYALAKLREETEELAAGLAAENTDNVAEEIGDVLFAAVCAARKSGVDPETALHRACEKFLRRFAWVEQTAAARGTPVETLAPTALEALYQEERETVEGKEKHFLLDKL